ncbi:SAM-dependent methyltransferase [Streptomyces sp. NPDC048473]|uniref:SAM-dependent methyltransferase n=1 Tax=unclassified Streptomyces TaxID=2593676 RepID=UPI00370FC92F
MTSASTSSYPGAEDDAETTALDDPEKILHFIEDAQAYGIVEALPPGSHVVLSHLAEDLNPVQIGKVAATYRERGFPFVLRSRAAVERFLTGNGLEALEPGVVPAHHWHPDHAAGRSGADEVDPAFLAGPDVIERTRYLDIGDVTDDDINVYVVVARKR